MYKLRDGWAGFFFYTTVLLMEYFVYLPLQISKDSFTAGFMLFFQEQKVCGFREVFLFNV